MCSFKKQQLQETPELPPAATSVQHLLHQAGDGGGRQRGCSPQQCAWMGTWCWGPGGTHAPCAARLAPALSTATSCRAWAGGRGETSHHSIGPLRCSKTPTAVKRSGSLKPLPRVLPLKPPVRSSSHSRLRPSQM